jgi:hypothetical protein
MFYRHQCLQQPKPYKGTHGAYRYRQNCRPVVQEANPSQNESKIDEISVRRGEITWGRTILE